MSDTGKITRDFKVLAETFIQSQFGGGNAGSALAGKYISESNDKIAASIDRLAHSVELLANRPINIVVNTVSNSTEASKDE